MRLALILLDLYFSALKIENTGGDTENFKDKDLIISGTVSVTSAESVEGLSKKMKKRKYHWLYSYSVILGWMKAWWRVNTSGGRFSFSSNKTLFLIFSDMLVLTNCSILRVVLTSILS